MNESLTQKIENDFDRIAQYDREGWDHNNHYHNFLLEQLPSHYKTVLDLGCGTGEFSRRLAKRADKAIGLDLSSKSIAVAKQRSERFSNIDFQVADIAKWEFPVEKFDAIASIATLHHLSVEALLPNLKSALKPGGKLVILDLLESETLQDSLSDAIAIPLNWVLSVKHKRVKPSPEAAEAMREHLRTDKFLTLAQVREIYPLSLQGVKIRKHLFWRYSAVWEKPPSLG